MGDAKAKKAADRAKRYRRHRQGDHSLCLIGNCPAITAVTVTEDVTAQLPFTDSGHHVEVPGLGERGQKLWDDVTASWSPSPLHAANLMEACRLADRLEQLDRQLKGRGQDWLHFWSRNDDGSEITVFVDKVVAEARENAMAFRSITADLIKAVGSQKPPVKGGGVLADLAAKRLARSAQTAG